MVHEPVNYLQCPSCLRRNNPEMQFCIYCGAGITQEAERRRTENPLFLRTCLKCGQADELNHNFCIYCSGRITVPGEGGADSNAFKKFSWELEQIDAKKLMAQQQIESAKQPVTKRKKTRKLGLTLPLALVGALSGAGLSFAIGPAGLERLALQFTWPKDGLVVYAKPGNADVLVVDAQNKVFTCTQTGADGSLCLTDLPSGKYTVSISAPGHLSVRQKSVPIQDKHTTVLGYPKKIELPADNKHKI